MTITGLAEGTYYLKEESAPAGYILPTDVIKLVVGDPQRNPQQSNIAVVAAWSTTAGLTSTNISVTEENGTQVLTVPNTPGVELPATGGTGTAVYTVSGLSVMAAALWLVMRRRRAD